MREADTTATTSPDDEIEGLRTENARLRRELDLWRSRAVAAWAEAPPAAAPDAGPEPAAAARAGRIMSRAAAVIRSRPRLHQFAAAFRAALRARTPSARP